MIREKGIPAGVPFFMRDDFRKWPLQESNLDLEFRKLLFYPLNYEAIKVQQKYDVFANDYQLVSLWCQIMWVNFLMYIERLLKYQVSKSFNIFQLFC